MKINLTLKVCEQLNGWIGGFESILKRMGPGKFDWFLHTMLFLQTQLVLNKEKGKASIDLEDAEDDAGHDGGDV